ncbi:MAG: DUF1553 domain-containing protein [Abditibacteriales bacterium]|nr:DUF1553 domain-containing protein [Abditibacteriales bacterium]MDW8365210.1 DUF1553 domain-containing protein [Abditibacteriales bacterium]
MPLRIIGTVLGVLLGGTSAFGAAKRSVSLQVDFNRDVRPILSRNCFACHGPDEGHRQAGLRLDTRAGATQPRGVRPPAIAPGQPAQSLLMLRVTTGTMPPAGSGRSLTKEDIDTLRRWIQQGAPYAEHWAFVKPQRPPLPTLASLPVAKGEKKRGTGWVINPIDYFILAKLEQAGLRPSPPADRYTLIRRLSLDLRGLPPTLEEVEAFVNDKSPDAYEKLVDRFLADPAFGERWARMWLDLARYADSAGYGSDPLRPNIWPYRDWVINAFNRNMPFDQFTIEQLAGDLLPHPTLEQRIATAFHRNTMTNTEGGTDDEEFRVAAVKDRIETTMQVWMGLTMRCAQCHSHKYDPISNKEYYQFFAFFNQTEDNDQPDERPTLPLPDAKIEAQIQEIDAKIAALKKQLDAPNADRKKIEEEIDKLSKSKPSLTAVPVMVELPEDKRRPTHLLIKGNFLNQGEKVEPGVPAAFHAFPADAPLNRLGVARWLVSPDNPLTARVAVNRFWAQIFGVGLVETEEDFGTQGALPSHPELLDWLAVEFMGQRVGGSTGDAKRAWDIKALLRLIVTSATYRQSSKVTPEKLAKDPRNRLLSRAPRLRLEAEMIRDQALALSGLLSRKIGGPSVYPPQPPGLWQAAFNNQRTWPTSTGEDRYRRGIYTFWRRTIPYPAMTTFDAPSREFCTVRRFRTNTPLQAFVTLNDPCFVECAQALARRIVREGGSFTLDRAKFALRLVLCRPPRPEQVKPIVALYESELAHYRKNKDAALALATDPLGPLPPGMDAAELAAWTVVSNVLLNLDGVLTKS